MVNEICDIAILKISEVRKFRKGRMKDTLGGFQFSNCNIL